MSASPSRVTVGVSSATEVSSNPVAGVPVTMALMGNGRLVSWLPMRIVTCTLEGLSVTGLTSTPRTSTATRSTCWSTFSPLGSIRTRATAATTWFTADWVPDTVTWLDVQDRVAHGEPGRLRAAVDLDGHDLGGQRVEPDGDLARGPVEDLDLGIAQRSR